MNQQQLQVSYLKGEVARLTEQNQELLGRLNEKTLLDRILLHALGGAAARLASPEEAAKYAIECVDHTLRLLAGVANPPATETPLV